MPYSAHLLRAAPHAVALLVAAILGLTARRVLAPVPLLQLYRRPTAILYAFEIRAFKALSQGPWTVHERLGPILALFA